MSQYAAGEKVTASKLSTLAGPESVRTSAVGTFTAHTLIDTITVPTVQGRDYKIVFDGQFSSTAADGYVRAFLREDGVGGTQLQLRQLNTASVSGQSFPLHMEARWTATVTGSKTFVVTAQRQAGTGSITAFASADSPAVLYVQNW